MNDLERQFFEWFDTALKANRDRTAALRAFYAELEAKGRVPERTVIRYRCAARGCNVATVVMAAGLTLCATRDYKYSPGYNLSRSVEAARVKNTIDGDRHWPGHVFDLNELASWGDVAGIDTNCRHQTSVPKAVEMLDLARSCRPGRPRTVRL